MAVSSTDFIYLNAKCLIKFSGKHQLQNFPPRTVTNSRNNAIECALLKVLSNVLVGSLAELALQYSGKLIEMVRRVIEIF